MEWDKIHQCAGLKGKQCVWADSETVTSLWGRNAQSKPICWRDKPKYKENWRFYLMVQDEICLDISVWTEKCWLNDPNDLHRHRATLVGWLKNVHLNSNKTSFKKQISGEKMHSEKKMFKLMHSLTCMPTLLTHLRQNTWTRRRSGIKEGVINPKSIRHSN